MKQLATIGLVVLLLIGAAFFIKSGESTEDLKPIPISVLDEPDKPDTKIPEPVVLAESAGTLSLKSETSKGYLTQGVFENVSVSVDITAADVSPSPRLPMEVVVVIDRSGSMRGEKMTHAKTAARNLLSKLSAQDRLSIVSYSNRVQVDMAPTFVSARNRVLLRRAIDNIKVGGATNISGGFATALSMFSHGTQGRVKRLILLSDGRPTEGIKDANQFGQLASNGLSSGVSTTTIGLGLDYNENLMTSIAKNGAGNYYFVDHPSQIVSFLNKEMTVLGGVVAQNARVLVTLNPGTNLVALHGFPHIRRGSEIEIPLADFSRGDQKNALLQLRTSTGAVGTKTPFAVRLSYDDAVKKKPTFQSVQLTSVSTDNPNQVKSGANLPVIERTQQLEYANSVTAAMDMWEAGDVKTAKKELKKAKKQMNKKRREFEFSDGAKYDRAAGSLDDMVSDMDAAPKPTSAPAKRARKKAKSKSFDMMRDGRKF